MNVPGECSAHAQSSLDYHEPAGKPATSLLHCNSGFNCSNCHFRRYVMDLSGYPGNGLSVPRSQTAPRNASPVPGNILVPGNDPAVPGNAENYPFWERDRSLPSQVRRVGNHRLWLLRIVSTCFLNYL
jgi:hypothetical protein